jgi:hypothetical protein
MSEKQIGIRYVIFPEFNTKLLAMKEIRRLDLLAKNLAVF